MPQDDFADNFNGCAGPACIGGCVPSQIMGPQVYADQFAGFFDNCQRCRIDDRKNSTGGADGLLADVFAEPLSHLLRNEDVFSLTAAFGIFEDHLLALHVHWFKLQHLTDVHPAAGHQFQDQPVARVFRPEDDLVNGFFFKDRPPGFWRVFEKFLENGRIARVVQLWTTQGYIWDTQSDMALALAGAMAALIVLGKLHNR